MSGCPAPVGDTTRSRAVRHLAQYLINDEQKVCFAYQTPYAEIVQSCRVACEGLGLAFDAVHADQSNIETLSDVLRSHPAVCLAFNRTYGGEPDEGTLLLLEAAREREALTWTVSDVHHRFDDVFATPPQEIVDRNQRLRKRARRWKHAVVQNRAGTELHIEFSDRYEWVSIDGFEERTEGLVVNLPPGEIATYPANVNGVIRFTGALLGTIPIGRKHGLVTDVLELVIEDGRCVSISGPSALAKDVEYCLGVAPHAECVVEIGLGTNSAIRSLEGLNYSFEEKHFGFHIGFGASLAQQNVERVTNHHLDFLFADAVLVANQEVVFDGSAYVDDSSYP